MSKRPLENGDEQPEQTRKKVKTQPAIDITSARQLQQILTFQQDAIPQLRTALKSFKGFLETIAYNEDKRASVKQQTILREYLDSQLPRHDGAVFLQDLMQAWGFALQTHNDGLLSAISAILALLLKTLSSLLDFRTVGSTFIDTLLDQAQLKIIARSLNAPKHKEHLISPVVRLLTEAASFDGGAAAAKVFNARASTFEPRTVARNLALGGSVAAVDKAHDSPSVRSNTIQYFLAYARFLPISAKIELLKQGVVFKALFDGVRSDSSELIHHTFNTIADSFLKVDEIPRKVKGFIFTTHNLSSISSLYRQDRVVKDTDLDPATTAHNFLLFVCTDPSAGVLRQQSGFYPPGTIKADHEQQRDEVDAQEIDLGLDSIPWYNSYTTSVPVRNGVLSSFLQLLKPYSYDSERLLLLAILERAPELVADYFFKSAFAFDPKLTATWVGYSTFLFSMLQQSLPIRFGRDEEDASIPPPVSIVIESILPKPLNSKVLTKCLNQQSELIAHFAARILVLAFDKLQRASRLLAQDGGSRKDLWSEANKRLRHEFITRCPNLKDVITSFRKLKQDNHLQRETILRLIQLYYTFTPQLATEERFDASPALVSALDAFEKEGDAKSGLERLELGHLLRIGQSTSATRWWHKPEGLRFSPFTCLLKIVAGNRDANSQAGMRQILSNVTVENDVFQLATSTPAIDALIASLAPSEEWTPPDTVFAWLDDVLARYVKRPIKYLDDLDALRTATRKGSASPLWLALVEQWPFVVSRAETPTDIATWLARYLSLSKAVGEDKLLLDRILDMLTAEKMNKSLKKILSKASLSDYTVLLPNPIQRDVVGVNRDSAVTEKSVELPGIHAAHFAPPSNTDDYTDTLHSAVTLPIEDAVSSGALSSLILCLSDRDVDIRTQAVTNLNIISKRLNTPPTQTPWPQSKQMYLLLGVLCNTASKLLKAAKSTETLTNGNVKSSDESDDEHEDINDLPIPYTVTAFASMAVPIVADPAHPIYANINRFILRGPSWDPDRLPGYWIHSLLREPPIDAVPTVHQAKLSSTSTTTDETSSQSTSATLRFDRTLHPLTHLPATNPFANSPYHTSIHFLLSYMYHLLMSTADLAILRRRGIFEPLLSLAADPSLPPALIDLLFGIVWRVTALRGGSTTLVTRAGIIAWLQGHLARRAGRGSGLAASLAVKALLSRIWATADQERVEAWASGALDVSVKAVNGD